MTLRIDPVAAAVQLLSDLIPDVDVRGDDTPDTRPVIVVRQVTGPADPDIPIIDSRVDIRCYGDPSAPSPVDQARFISARVYGALHRRHLTDVWVAGYETGLDKCRLYRSMSIVGEQLFTDQETDEEFVFDTYELTWADRFVLHRFAADAAVSVNAA